MSGVVLTAEQRAEVERTVTEVMEWVAARTKAGRSSMPIYCADAALLCGMAAVALDLIDAEPTTSTTDPKEQHP